MAAVYCVAIDFAAHRWQPRYGWTNLALYVLCAMAAVLLTLALGLPMQTAMLADLTPVRLRR